MDCKGELLSRIAAGDGHGENSSYFDGWKAYDMDPFDLHRNPGGVIQMGLAENQVSIVTCSLSLRHDKRRRLQFD